MKDVDKKAVGRRIKQIRMNKGYTLEAFGKFFNVMLVKVMFNNGKMEFLYQIKIDYIIFQK